jgi:molybdopterin converting factor small subunit
MIKIKLFGTLRLKTGCKEIDADIKSIREAYGVLAQHTGLKEKEFKQCVIAVNGTPCKVTASLQEGDEIAFFSPSGGG